MKQVFSCCGDSVLLVVGEERGSGCREVSEATGFRDRIIFTGEKPFAEIPDFLACADVAVSPRIECPGTPQKITNYMAAGKAIVCFAGSASLLSDNENGLVVANGDINAMSEAIISLLQSTELRRKLGAKAREALLSRYNWPLLCNQLQALYQRLAC
jgi:glycosyltransferase involved in cell wall biosynthesis